MLRTIWCLCVFCLIEIGAEKYDTPVITRRSTKPYMPSPTEENKKADSAQQKTDTTSGLTAQQLQNVFGDSYKFGKTLHDNGQRNNKDTIHANQKIESENTPEKRNTNQFTDTWDNIDLEEEPFDSDISGIDRKRFVMRNAYLGLVKSIESLNDKLYAAHRNFKAQNNMDVTKRPLIHGSTWRTGERPYIFGPGWRPGKRVSDYEGEDFADSKYLYDGVIDISPYNRIDETQDEISEPNREIYSKDFSVYDHELDEFDPVIFADSIDKRPFVFGSGRYIGKRDSTLDNMFDKRPFVMSSGGYFGKRKSFRQANNLDRIPLNTAIYIGKPQTTMYDSNIGQTPYELNSENSFETSDPINKDINKRPFGKRNLQQNVVKRPFVFGSGGYFGKRSEVTKRPFVFGSGGYFGKRGQDKYGVMKRPFVFGSGGYFGKRGDELSEINKRPLVFGSGRYFGKRGLTGYEAEKRPFVFGSGKYFGKRDYSENEVDKRPFVFGSGKYFGKRDLAEYKVDKRPFVFGSGKYFGKRGYSAYEVDKRPFVFGSGKYFGKRDYSENEVDKRPFVFGSGKYFGKRDLAEYKVDKRPFVFGSGKYFGKRGYSAYEVDKRPFVFGSGKYFGKRDLTVDKRPFVFGSGKYFGKRDSPEYEVNKRPFIFGSGRYFGKRDSIENGVNKRPFVFGSGKYFGKRDSLDYENEMSKRPFVFGSGKYFGKRASPHTLIRKRPFVFGSGGYFGKRDNLENTLNRDLISNEAFAKRPAIGTVYGGGFKFGKRQHMDTLGISDQFLTQDFPIYS